MWLACSVQCSVSATLQQMTPNVQGLVLKAGKTDLRDSPDVSFFSSGSRWGRCGVWIPFSLGTKKFICSGSSGKKKSNKLHNF